MTPLQYVVAVRPRILAVCTLQDLGQEARNRRSARWLPAVPCCAPVLLASLVDGLARLGKQKDPPMKRWGVFRVHSACAPVGIRTPNLLIRSQMLYPLSYGRLSRTATAAQDPMRIAERMRLAEISRDGRGAGPGGKARSGAPEHGKAP